MTAEGDARKLTGGLDCDAMKVDSMASPNPPRGRRDVKAEADHKHHREPPRTPGRLSGKKTREGGKKASPMLRAAAIRDDADQRQDHHGQHNVVGCPAAAWALLDKYAHSVCRC